jgi:glycosyltransferase involved in cell wall biosynthesis
VEVSAEARPGITVVVPAYNEERFLPETLASLAEARRMLGERFALPSEVVVVDNASTDRTAEVARGLGARVVPHGVRNIASVRNAGIRAAAHELVVTVDADTWVPPDSFVRIWDAMSAGAHVGGGVRMGMRTARLRMRVALAIIEPVVVAITGTSAGMFFFWRRDALALGGFPESLLAGEDVAFARALRDHGRATGRPYLNLRTVRILTFDRKDASLAQSLRAVLVGAKCLLGVRTTERELEFWYRPKR